MDRSKLASKKKKKVSIYAERLPDGTALIKILHSGRGYGVVGLLSFQQPVLWTKNGISFIWFLGREVYLTGIAKLQDFMSEAREAIRNGRDKRSR